MAPPHPAAGGSQNGAKRRDVTTTHDRVVHAYRLRLTIDTPVTTGGRSGVHFLKHARKTHNPPGSVATDLVEYFIVSVPNVESLVGLGPALAKLVKRAAIRILDVVVLVKDDDGEVTLLELDVVDSMASLRELEEDVGAMLSDHDLELAALALEAGTTGVVIVTEDRWAKPLSSAARRAGGQIIAGDRIPASRVASVLAERSDETRERNVFMTTTKATRNHGHNLLGRPPCGVRVHDDAWMAFVVDPVEQLSALADLHVRGLLSSEEFERQKAKVIER